MKFIETKLRGAFVIEIEPIRDERGFFARGFCIDEFARYGLNPGIAQINVGYNAQAGIVRGMHFQRAPHAEVKIVRCTAGAIHDVIIDLRPESPTFKQWVGVELSAENRRTLYVPEGFAHGYQSLRPDTEMYYMTSQRFAPTHATGVRHDDPEFAIEWPLPVTLMSNADRNWPAFSLQHLHGGGA